MMDLIDVAIRSDAQLVVVEAPAGCGKTHQGADYANELSGARDAQRVLILTHTHAACSVFAGRTFGASSRVEIATIDSLIASIAGTYHAGLGLPADIAAWVRQRKDGYGELALRVATLLRRHPMVAMAAARRYPVVLCDEHQDSSGDQHAIVMAMAGQGSRVRIFADPMQRIFPDKPVKGALPRYDWNALTGAAHAFERLDFPHRWNRGGCPDLGAWTLKARETLQNNGCVDLRHKLPDSVHVVFAENQSQVRTLGQRCASAQHVYDAVRLEVDRANQTREEGHKLTPPSLRTVQRRVSLVSALDLEIAETSPEFAKRKFTHLQLSRRVTRILELVEIDHTPADIIVVNEDRVTVGRPDMTIVLDRRSRCVLGFHLSLAGHGVPAVFEALRHALLPKALQVLEFSDASGQLLWRPTPGQGRLCSETVLRL